MSRFIPLCLLLILSPLGAEVDFSGLNLSNDGRILFKVATPAPGSGAVSGWFMGPPKARNLDTLTFMPEQLHYLGKTGQIQIQNRFGLYRSTPDLKFMSQVNPLAFVNGRGIPEGKLLPQATSSDGRFLVYQNPTSLLRGDLVLYEPASGKSWTVSAGLPLNFRQVPVLWSPDSQFFVYALQGQVHYFSVRQLDESRIPQEKFRVLGKGTLSSAAWGEDSSLYLVLEEFVYRILPQQFFTHSLYGGLFRTGSVVGILPQKFDPDKDQFWMAGERDWVLLNLRGRSLFLYPLEIQDFYAHTQPIVFKPLASGLEVLKVLWAAKGQATVLSRSLIQGKEQYEVFRLTATGLQTLAGAQDSPIRDILLSPQGTEIALITSQGASLRDPVTFRESRLLSLEGTALGAYKAEGEIILSGRTHTALFSPSSPQGELLFFNELDQTGFSADGTLLGASGGKIYSWKGKGRWALSESTLIPPSAGVTADWRIYLEPQARGPYSNMIMVRDLKAGGTFNLLAYPERNYDPFPAADENRPSDLFTHGSRLRRRQVSLSLDAATTSEGLSDSLRVLRDYGFKTTFFINGEFMRRQPNAALELSRSGHEAANGFSLWFDMADPRFKMDQAFVKSGLTRNEDDWFNLTGKELSLIWHAPQYYLDDTVVRGGQAASYTYVSRDVEYPKTWNEEVDILESMEIILRDKKPGSVIPLTLGMKDGKTGEGFFKYLDILVNALVLQGYEIVPVSVLKENTR